ncbi:hypothetical protein BgAZ_305640 [Babesia gibsoni]|uniref:Uncharacterized protein n=1 Tax=Babesia gibsoni TaxID=33632 RepID=A0AAD8LPU8_BABGI|nr:hypothetical protein BgAZ_305640 [Babesia gibsoni]
MVDLRRISCKKTRFSCKKIAYSELRRFQQSEYIRALTWRKRLERVHFLPEVKDEVKALSHESVQSILCQGSPFHFSKQLTQEATDSLENLLFGDLTSVKKLGNHELLLLLSLLQKLSIENISLLSKVLEECIIRFHSLAFAEVAHVTYKANTLPESVKQTFVQRWIPKVVSSLHLLGARGTSSGDLSSVAKITYALSQHLSQKDDILVTLLSQCPMGEEPDERVFSRNCSLIAQSMLKTDIVNYEFLHTASEFYHNAMKHHIDLPWTQHRGDYITSISNVVFSLEEAVEAPFPTADFLHFMDTSEFFGYHNKDLFVTFQRYIDLKLEYFIRHPHVAAYYRGDNDDSKSQITQRFLELVKSQRYKHTVSGKQDLQRLMKDMLASPRRERRDVWRIDDIYTIGLKYVTKREVFAKFLDVILCKGKLDKLSTREREMLKDLCQIYARYDGGLLSHISDMVPIKPFNNVFIEYRYEFTGKNYKVVPQSNMRWFPHGPDFDELCRSYMKEGKEEHLKAINDCFQVIVSYLPRVSCWDSVWRMLSVIDKSRCMEMLPLVRSFLEESFLGFHRLTTPLKTTCSVASYLIKNVNEADDYIIQVDSCARILELLLTCEGSRDYACLHTFGNVIELYVELKCALDRNAPLPSDIRSIMDHMSSTLRRYLMEFTTTKKDIFSLPVTNDLYDQVRRSIALYNNADFNSEYITPERTLELLRCTGQSVDTEFLQINAEFIRHILLHGIVLSDSTNIV